MSALSMLQEQATHGSASSLELAHKAMAESTCGLRGAFSREYVFGGGRQPVEVVRGHSCVLNYDSKNHCGATQAFCTVWAARATGDG